MLYAYSYDLCTDSIFEYDMEQALIEKERINLLWSILNSMPEKEKGVFKYF